MSGIEIIGWVVLGFSITIVSLELATKILIAKISNRLFLRR
jgi:hypothetical protein